MISTPALYDTLRSLKDIHKVVLNLADDLTDEQLNRKPAGYSASIGFHLWHLARESDDLKAALLRYSPQFISEFGDGKEIWELDTKISNFENMNEELKKKIEMIRLNLLVFLSHDCRHSGMMKCLKG